MKFDTPSSPSLRWDIFCRVIDNHGDLGVCWRLASQLAARGQQVRLWVELRVVHLARVMAILLVL